MNIIKLIVNRLYCAVLSLDQLGSAVIFGRPDHTVSGEVGYAATLNKRWALRAEKLLDKVFGEKTLLQLNRMGSRWETSC